MKKLLLIFAISLTVTAAGLLLMNAVAVRNTQPPVCCDQQNLEKSYGFPWAFRQVYSGGITGASESTTISTNMFLDGIVIFAITVATVSAVVFLRKRSANKSS